MTPSSSSSSLWGEARALQPWCIAASTGPTVHRLI
jgi:hypothetical protein